MFRVLRALALALFLWVPDAVASDVGEIDRHIASGQLNAAFQKAEEGAVADPRRSWLRAYVQAHILLARGGFRRAEATARRLLSTQPRNVRVRHLLINTLVAQRKYRAATFHIRRNQEHVSDPAIRAQYRQALTDIYKRNPKIGLSLSLSAVPSTNVTKGTKEETIYLNGLPFKVGEESREKKGNRISAGLTAYGRLELGESSDIVVSTTTTLEKSTEGSSEELLTVAPALQYQYRLDRLLLSAGPIAEIQWQDWQLYAHRIGAAASASYFLSDRTQVGLALRMLDQTYPDREHLNGYRLTLEPRLRIAVLPDLAATAALKLEREKTRAEHLTYDLVQLRLGLEKTWSSGFYTDVEASLQTKRYDGAIAIASDHRRDDRLEVQIGFAHERFSFFGIMPYVGYRYTRNRSNVPLYDYESNDLIVSGRKKF